MQANPNHKGEEISRVELETKSKVEAKRLSYATKRLLPQIEKNRTEHNIKLKTKSI